MNNELEESINHISQVVYTDNELVLTAYWADELKDITLSEQELKDEILRQLRIRIHRDLNDRNKGLNTHHLTDFINKFYR